MQKKEIKVSVSVTDSPILIPLEQHLASIKATGTDGIEITPGFKSRWNFQKVKQIADSNHLTITAIHQPPWSIAGLWFDEGCIAEATKVGIENVVFHPPAKLSFDDDQMKQFLTRLSDMQKKYGINALLENMPWAVRPKLLRKYIPYPENTTDPLAVYEATKKFGLGMTLDTSHIFDPKPHTKDWFPKILPGIKNIHLSSFIKNKDHLPLDMGNLKSPELIAQLIKKNYQGLITLEIFYPKKVSLKSYDYNAVKRSIKLIKDSQFE